MSESLCGKVRAAPIHDRRPDLDVLDLHAVGVQAVEPTERVSRESFTAEPVRMRVSYPSKCRRLFGGAFRDPLQGRNADVDHPPLRTVDVHDQQEYCTEQER